MDIKHTPGPWYVVPYHNGDEWRETLQHRDRPLDWPSFCFNTEVGQAQAEADRRNSAKATGSPA